VKIKFDRQEYMALKEIFDVGQLDDVTTELSEFSDDIEDMAYELAYTRYELAKVEARHNALVEAVHKAMDRTVDCDKKQTNDQLIADVAYLKRLASDHFKTSVDCGNRAFAAEQKYDALVDAVKKMFAANCNDYWDAMEYQSARAEVDRLLQEEK